MNQEAWIHGLWHSGITGPACACDGSIDAYVVMADLLDFHGASGSWQILLVRCPYTKRTAR